MISQGTYNVWAMGKDALFRLGVVLETTAWPSTVEHPTLGEALLQKAARPKQSAHPWDEAECLEVSVSS